MSATIDLWTAADWVSRVGFSACFLVFGSAHFLKHQGLTGYAQSKRVPAASAMVWITGAMMLAGAVMILFHWHAIWGSALIVGFLVPTAFMMHDYWTESDPMMRANQQAHFFKNLALAFAAGMYAVAIHR